jgi:spermidine/putrescine transport system ATP-binding protein
MGESTIVPGRVEENGQIRTALGLLDVNGQTPGTDVYVAIRPEHVQLGGQIRATVKDVVYQGSFKRVTAALTESPELNLLARLPSDVSVKVNAPVLLSVKPDRLIILKD